MAEIVGVFATSHTPVMMNFADQASEEERLSTFESFRNLGDMIAKTRPDALLILSDDHVHNFFLNNLPAFCIGATDHYPSPVEHWLKAEKRVLPGHAALGAFLIQHVIEADFDPSLSMELTLDHGVLTPLELAKVNRDIPIVPILFNCVQPPMPTMKRSYKFGQALRAALKDCPFVDRVAVLATGGISHDVGTPRMGMINEDFDRRFLALLEAGEAEAAVRHCAQHVNEAGNGAEEVRMWLAAMGIAGAAPFQTHFYRAIKGWYTGVGMGHWQLS